MSDDATKSKIRLSPSLTTTRLGFHVDIKPFDDIRVRQAVALALDKQALVQKSGGAIAALEGHFTPPLLQYDKDFKSNYAYNVEAAKQLMVEAGYGDGVKGVQFFIGQAEEAGQLLQADLAAIGIETELKKGQWKDWRDGIRAGDITLFMYGWAASFPDAYDFCSAWTSCKSSETGYNDGYYCNTKIDEIIDRVEALPLTDPERIKGYREIEDIVINQDVAWVGRDNPQRLSLGKSYVHDDFMSPIYGWPYLETAWMESP